MPSASAALERRVNARYDGYAGWHGSNAMDASCDLLACVSRERLDQWLYYLCADPLACRQANPVRPGETRGSLDEADAYRVRARRHGIRRAPRAGARPGIPARSQSSAAATVWPPEPDDPWYTLYNLHAMREGAGPDAEIIQMVAHKDSQSWVPCAPGAYDSAVDTVALMELARTLAQIPNEREIRFLWCNEEHTPWTSVMAAQRLAASGRKVAIVLNLDGVGLRRPDHAARGIYTADVRYTTDRGRSAADLVDELIGRHNLGIRYVRERAAVPDDDDGSFVLAGIENAILLTGWIPNPDPHYHTTEDRYEYVGIESVARSVALALSLVLFIDRYGAP